MFLAHIIRREDGNERRRRSRILHIRPALGFFALYQAHHSNNFESEFARRFNRLNRRRPRCANVVHNHDPRTLLAEAFNALSRTVLLLGLAHQKSVQFPAHDRNRDHNRIRPHREPADSTSLPTALPNLLDKNFPGQALALRVERGSAAVDVVVAGPTGRKFELTQPERLVSQRAQQFLTRGGNPTGRHENLRYHVPPSSSFPWAEHPVAAASSDQRRSATFLWCGWRDNLKILPNDLRGITLPSPRKFPFFIPISFFLSAIAISALGPLAHADGTRTWEQSRFDDLTKGTATGVAIRSSGGLELAPSFKLLCATPSTYIWAVAADEAGNIYAATGSPARVYRITPDGQATIIFEPQELQVQALRVGPHGIIYAATAPDGKVYKLEHKPREKGDAPKTESKTAEKDASKDPAKPILDPAWTSSEYFAPGTKYIWDLALDKAGNLYVATGDHGEIFKVTPKGEHAVFFKSDDTHIRVLALDYRGNDNQGKDVQGNLIAGTDGSGLVYRISPAGEGFVLYSAPKKEITALAIDRAGNIYAAGVGEKRASAAASSAGISAAMLSMTGNSTASTSPQTPGMTLSVTPSTPQAGSFPFPGASAGNGSDVYRIAADGSPSRKIGR